MSQPFGMTQWCAATRINGISKTMYHYSDTTFLGVMATHQPAIWMGDYGFFTMMPQAEKLKISADEREVKLDRSKEEAIPHYYKVAYESENKEIVTEFSATSRSAIFNISYSDVEKPILFLEARRDGIGGEIEIIPERGEIRICNREKHDRDLGPELPNFAGYYVLNLILNLQNTEHRTMEK